MSSPATKLEASSAEERDQIASSSDGSPHFHEKEADDARPKDVAQAEEVESASDLNLDYNDNDEEPALHARTYFALAAMFMLNMVQVLALQSPPAVLEYIGADLNNAAAAVWVPDALSLVQAVVGPIISSISDTFQARKTILVSFCAISFIGSAIAPGSTTMGRLIAAQTLIGFGFATVPLAYCIPSEILPRKWRPLAQSGMNIAAAFGGCLGPIVIGALTQRNELTGWRDFYWFQMALWGVCAIGILVGYQPPRRHTKYDHLSFAQKLMRLDLIGTALLTAGLTLLLVGLILGGATFPWTAAPVLGTLITGILVCIGFCLYEWLGTKNGILHHDLFRGGRDQGRTFSLCVVLIFLEGVLLFAYTLFYPTMISTLFDTGPLLLTVRLLPFWVSAGLITIVYGYVSTKLRTIKSPLFVGFLIYTAGIVGLATIQPQDSTSSIIFAALAGLGFGSPLIIIVAGVQLSTPHHLIATATAVTTSARAVGATVFTAIYSAAYGERVKSKVPSYIAKAAIGAGLPASSVGGFIEALTTNNATALQAVTHGNSAITAAGAVAMKHAYADSVRVVFIIAAPFGAVACIICFFLGDMKKTMNYHVDAPVEKLVAKHRQDRAQA